MEGKVENQKGLNGRNLIFLWEKARNQQVHSQCLHLLDNSCLTQESNGLSETIPMK